MTRRCFVRFAAKPESFAAKRNQKEALLSEVAKEGKAVLGFKSGHKVSWRPSRPCGSKLLIPVF
jgi:hypothetical protein